MTVISCRTWYGAAVIAAVTAHSSPLIAGGELPTIAVLPTQLDDVPEGEVPSADPAP